MYREERITEYFTAVQADPVVSTWRTPGEHFRQEFPKEFLKRTMLKLSIIFLN